MARVNLRVKRQKRDIIKATKDGAENLVRALVLQGEANSKQIARVDTGALRQSITSEVSGMRGSWHTDIAYAKAQEYGIPGTSYGFTPFLRPAAIALRRIVGKFAKVFLGGAYAKASLKQESN